MRIAIVNDVKMIVTLLKQVVFSQHCHELAWIAYNGLEAVEKCKDDVPDLILMDLAMPVMNGVEATEYIMKNTPCAILIVTSSFNSHLSMVFKAMGFGALDVVKTPTLDSKQISFSGEELLFKIDKIAHLIGKGSKKPILSKTGNIETSKSDLPKLVIIGSSTGGPMALTKVLSSFPQHPPFATIIIQHVDQQFAPSFAKWLGSEVSQNVEIAIENMKINEGSVLIAGKNEHLVVTESKTLHYNKQPIDNPFRPSVDVFFSSMASHWPHKCVAIVLTGMGSDGAKGMKTLYDAGWYTIAEDRSTCIVFGMPKAAIDANAVTSVLPLDQIGPTVLSLFESNKI